MNYQSAYNLHLDHVGSTAAGEPPRLLFSSFFFLYFLLLKKSIARYLAIATFGEQTNMNNYGCRSTLHLSVWHQSRISSLFRCCFMNIVSQLMLSGRVLVS
jgi:hypothetical protein